MRGETQALLQIGTGFHPNLTGRENALAYLSHIGVHDRSARERIDEIIEFAELEEYIDQPLKTYSTGMGMRLMFAAATVIAPSLLVVDEVLGVGDAISLARVGSDSAPLRPRIDDAAARNARHLQRGDVVPADNRLDRGRVMVDGAPGEVVKAYEDSIRVQEEHRLRTRRLSAFERAPGVSGANDVSLLIEIHARHNRPQPSPVDSQPDRVDGRPARGCASAARRRAPSGASQLQMEATCWGAPVEWQGEASRPMPNYGSPFHKVAGVLAPSDVVFTKAGTASPLRLRVVLV